MENLKEFLKSKEFKEEAYNFLLSKERIKTYRNFSFKFDKYLGEDGFFFSRDKKEWHYIPKIKRGFSKEELNKIFKKDKNKLAEGLSASLKSENAQLNINKKRTFKTSFCKNDIPFHEKGIIRSFVKTLDLNEDTVINPNSLSLNMLTLSTDTERIIINVNEDVVEYFSDLAKEVLAGEDFDKYFKVKRIKK